MPTTAFDPAVHGFAFDNRFVNVVADLPGGARIRTHGRCGGMAYAALDIFHAGRTAPPAPVTDPPGGVPPDGSPLADYILERLFDSYLEPSAVRFLAWTLLPDDRTRLFKGVAAWTDEEIPLLRRAIDAGSPVVLGLIGARAMRDIGRRNHQVIAHGYERSGRTTRILVHDNNRHAVPVILTYTSGTAGVHSTHRAEPWRGLFVHTYEPKVPPDTLWS